MIFSSDQDFTLWPTPGTKLKVDLAKTTLTLPIVDGNAGWKRAMSEKQDGDPKRKE
jgi:X-Pro dipeptidyl-peptidase